MAELQFRFREIEIAVAVDVRLREHSCDPASCSAAVTRRSVAASFSLNIWRAPAACSAAEIVPSLLVSIVCKLPSFASTANAKAKLPAAIAIIDTSRDFMAVFPCGVTILYGLDGLRVPSPGTACLGKTRTTRQVRCQRAGRSRGTVALASDRSSDAALARIARPSSTIASSAVIGTRMRTTLP